MSEISTTLPTEPGIYLFAGVTERRFLNQMLRHPPRPVLLRVSHDAKGKLRYIGSDFWYRPEEAVGAWIKIEGDALVERALQESHDAFLKEVVQDLRQATVNELKYHLTGRWGEFRMENKDQAKMLVERALELGLVEKESD